MSRFATFALVVLLCAAAFAQKPVAKLPIVSVDTTYNLPTGTTWLAHTSAQFSSALNVSQPGDVIVLDAGTVYYGNFQVPAKVQSSQPKWIYIRSSAANKLPPPGTRINPPVDSVNMPKIVTPNASQAINFLSGSSYIRLVGVEVYSASTYAPAGYTPGVKYGYALISLPGTWPPKLPIPDHIIFDRVYVHGDPAHDVQAGIQANFSNVAVVDSYVSEIHMKGTDTCAVCAFFSPGPFYIRNNYLSAAGENIIFGGSGQNYNPWVPGDITITNNWLDKPLNWVPLSTGSAPAYVVKNAFELKSAQRVLFDSNLVTNVWASAQLGFAVVLTVRSSQSGDIAVVNDVTITNNVFKNVVSGFNTGAKDDQCGAAMGYPNCHNAGSQDRWNISNNLILFYDPALLGGQRNLGINLQPGLDRINGNIPGVLRNVVFQHNTMVSAASTPCWNAVFFGGGGQKPPYTQLTNNIWLADNVLCRQPTGDWGLQGTSGLTQYMGYPGPVDARFLGNVISVPKSDKVQTFPVHNFATTVPLTFVNTAGGDYHLASPYWTDTTDGKLAGLN